MDVQQILMSTILNAIKATIQYEENLQVLFVALNTVGTVSVNWTHEILSAVFNIPIATETISNMVKRCTGAVSGTVKHDKTESNQFRFRTF